MAPAGRSRKPNVQLRDELRVGILSCGYDPVQIHLEDVESIDQLRQDPSYYYVFSWDRRAVDVAVFNAQGHDSIAWWPVHGESRPGDIMIFSLAPHFAIPFEEELGEAGKWFAESESQRDGPKAQWEPDRSIRETGSEYCSNPSEVLKPEVSGESQPPFGDWRQAPVPGFPIDGDGYSEACFPYGFQGLGVITDKPIDTKMKFPSTGNTVFQTHIGHVVLFPSALSGKQVTELVNRSQELEKIGVAKGVLRPETPMEELVCLDSPWLPDGEEFLTSLHDNADQLFGDSNAQEVKRDLARIDAAARKYRSGERPGPGDCPPVRWLTDWNDSPTG